MFAFTMTENSPPLMKRPLTLSWILLSVCCSVSLGSSEYHLINISRSYQEAKEYCRETFTDLATVTNSEDMSDLINLVPSTTPRAWIGLERGNMSIWHWTLSEQPTDFFNWRSGEPQENTQAACGAMDQAGTWFESDCNTRRNFICQDTGETSGHMLVAEAKTWRKAQNHCRELSTDLVSIFSAEDNLAVQNVFADQEVWIGLFKDPWIWSDGSNFSFRFWKPNQPNSKPDQDCTVAVFKDDGQWNDVKCGGKSHFICQGARKPTLTTPNSLSTKASFTTRKPRNPTSPSMTPSQMTSVGENWSTHELPNVTDSTTSATAATTTGAPNPATPKESSSQGPTNQTAAINSWPSGNLILIRKNMTWIEALSYCRRHHSDLVQVTTTDVQDAVAELMEYATSAYVWLGLRYTCQFHFWFWTGSPSACYQNWQPGHGSERDYDCGASGAINATGGQQWVGLPETERLNFMCSMCAG